MAQIVTEDKNLEYCSILKVYVCAILCFLWLIKKVFLRA